MLMHYRQKWKFIYKEFVVYYKELGYNYIYLYDNNNIDDEKFEGNIYNEINKGFITLINYRGIRGENINPKLEAYKNCYEKYNMKYDCHSFFDVNEYLELNIDINKNKLSLNNNEIKQ